jgi:hypothetical protein
LRDTGDTVLELLIFMSGTKKGRQLRAGGLQIPPLT